MKKSQRSVSPREQKPAAKRPPANAKVVTNKQSMTIGHLTASLDKVYDIDATAFQRIVAAGMMLRVRDLLLRRMDQALSEFGTSHARFQVLAIICHESEGLQLSEIAAQASVHPTTLTSTVDRLVRDGLIERRANPNDRRGIFAVGTRKGYELYRKARASLSGIEYGLSDVDTATISKLIVNLDRVALQLERQAASA